MNDADPHPTPNEPHAGAPPEDAGDPVPPTTAQKIGIWIVGGYFLLQAIGGLVSMFLLAGRAVPVSAEKLDFIESLPQPLFFAGFIEMFCSLAGGVFLLMRRRLALPFLLAAAGVRVLSHLFTPTPASLGVASSYYAVAMIGEWVLTLAALAYVVALWRGRVLAA